MNHREFRIGLEFYTVEGRRWKVTDVGTRTVMAIVLDERGEPVVPDPAWLQGPPYVVEETLFDEKAWRSAYLDPYLGPIDRMNAERLHPGFTSKAMRAFGQRRRSKPTGAPYPHPRLLRFERLGEHEILSPYGAVRNAADDGWDILVYHVYADSPGTLPETVFLHRPLITPELLRTLKAHHAAGSADPSPA